MNVHKLRNEVARGIRSVIVKHPALGPISRHPMLANVRRALLAGRIELDGPGQTQPATWDYETFRRNRIRQCEWIYPDVRVPGLLSFITTVWNTPVEYLRVLAESLLGQYGDGGFEWVILDNGSSEAETIAYLATLGSHPAVRLFRTDANLGIIGGMRYCLERAKGRYILPLDSDDYLYPKCVSILTSTILQNGYPPLLYSDEDKLFEGVYRDPYYKPDWDPVLFVNSCFIAHLCAIDRVLALELGAYTDDSAEGSHDWDSFMRFYTHGYTPVHVPEVLYSWRMHPHSTSFNIRSKPVVYDSQKAVLRKFIAAQQRPDHFDLVLNPLFPGTPDWWIQRQPVEPQPIHAVRLGEHGRPYGFDPAYPSDKVTFSRAATNAELAALLEDLDDDALVQLQGDRAEAEGAGWAWEALGQFELFPDCAMVGGRILSRRQYVLAAAHFFGYGHGCGSPDRGRTEADPGYFATMWKNRSVSAVSAEFCFVRAGLLRETLRAAPFLSFAHLGAWCGLHARKKGLRVIYSPHLTAQSTVDWHASVSRTEHAAFVKAALDQLPEARFMSPHLSLETASPYRPVDPTERQKHLMTLLQRHEACRAPV